MREDIDTILDKCLSQMRSGEADIEACLARYPKHASQLQPLLEAASLLWQAPQPQPKPEAVSRGEELLLKAVAERQASRALHNSVQRPKTGGIASKIRRLLAWIGGPKRVPDRRRFQPVGLRWRWAGVAVGVAVFFSLSAGGIAASGNSMPGELLYPVKIATEKARLTLTPSDVGKAGLHIAFAERRVQEIAEMGRRGGAEEVTILATSLAQNLEETKRMVEAIAVEGGDISDLQARLEQSAAQQLGILEETLDEVPEQTKSSIAEALKRTGEEYGTAIEVTASAAPTPMLVARMGTIQIRATDPPPPQVDSVLVEVEKIEVHRAGGPDSGWITIVAEPVTFDLLEVAEVQKFLGSQEVPEGTYTQVRFSITEAKVIVGDEEHIASVPSGTLKLVRPFQVKEGETTLVLIDFDGSKSLHITGNGQYKLKPVVKLLVPPPAEGVEAKERNRERKETKVEIEGTIARFNDTELVVVVAGQEVTVTIDTPIKIKGDLQDGSWTKIKALVKDGSFLATEIKVQKHEKETKQAEKQVEKEAKEAEKQAEKEAEEAEKEAKEAEKQAEKEAKEAEKDAKDAGGDGGSGGGKGKKD